MQKAKQFPRIIPSRLTGDERLHVQGQPIFGSVLDFWQWAGSDLVSNTFRGWLAEYLVARAIGVTDAVRQDWLPYDLKAPNGAKVEVKSSAYIQNWYHSELSTPRFDIAAKRAWDPDTDTMAGVPARLSDVYVFCLHKHQVQSSIDPLNLDQWRFFVLRTRLIDERLGDQKSVGLATLADLDPFEVDFQGLKDAVDRAYASI